MQATLAQQRQSRQFVRTASNVYTVRPVQAPTNRLRGEAETMLSDIATALHYAKICRNLKIPTTVAAK